MKAAAMLELAKLRQSTHLEGYLGIGEFHDGVFECDHVSPLTKSGSNVDAEVMVVGQDWASADFLSKTPPDERVVELGFNPDLWTNKHLDALLDRHFGVRRQQCYLTNVFPFVKPGGMSAGIRFKDLVFCARKFTFREIEIVSPRYVICLGLNPFRALRRALGATERLNLDAAIKSPLTFERSRIHCVAHTGRLGTINRGRDGIHDDWQRIVKPVSGRSPTAD